MRIMLRMTRNVFLDSDPPQGLMRTIIKNYNRSFCLSIENRRVPDPEVFGPPESGSVSLRYGSGFPHHQTKIVRKPLISTVL
jgi:hypothetical protein